MAEDLTITVTDGSGGTDSGTPTLKDSEALNTLREILETLRTQGGRGRRPPATPQTGRKKSNDSQVRIEGIFNLLKGGMNVRVRGIQRVTIENLKALSDRVFRKKSNNQGALLASGVGLLARLGFLFRFAGRLVFAFKGLAIAGGALALGFVAFAAAANKARKALGKVANSLIQDLGKVSPSIALAKANAQISNMRNLRQIDGRVGPQLGRQIAKDQELTEAVRELNAEVIDKLGGVLEWLTGFQIWITETATTAVGLIGEVTAFTKDALAFLKITDKDWREIEAKHRGLMKKKKLKDEKEFSKSIVKSLMHSVRKSEREQTL